MINYYWISIKGKNIRSFLNQIFKNKINIEEIIYKENELLLKTSYDNYKKILLLKTSCKITIVKISGTKRIKQLYQKYKLSLISIIISVLFISFISSQILYINIESDNNLLKKEIKEELKRNNVSLYTNKKSYQKLKEITKRIKNSKQNEIEWIELEEKGVYLNIKVIPRIDKKTKEKIKYQDIIAEKDGYIRRIYSKEGQIIKNIDDYVKKDEVIISGNIFKNDKVIGKTRASGKVYAETWYIVKASKDMNYNEMISRKKGKLEVVLNIKEKEIELFSINKKVSTKKEKTLFANNDIKIEIKERKESYLKKQKYNDLTLKNILEKRVQKEILNHLEKDEYIILQKTLKKYVKNDKMYIEVFFKCYENIAKEKELKKIKEKKDGNDD